MQAYLNMAYDKVKEMNREGGRITNTELQRMVLVFFTTNQKQTKLADETFNDIYFIDCADFFLFVRCSYSIFRTSRLGVFFDVHFKSFR